MIYARGEILDLVYYVEQAKTRTQAFDLNFFYDDVIVFDMDGKIENRAAIESGIHMFHAQVPVTVPVLDAVQIVLCATPGYAGWILFAVAHFEQL
jgi:hypothetical protein